MEAEAMAVDAAGERSETGAAEASKEAAEVEAEANHQVSQLSAIIKFERFDEFDECLISLMMRFRLSINLSLSSFLTSPDFTMLNC